MSAPAPLAFGLLERSMVADVIMHLATATAVWWPGGQAAGAPVPGLRVVFDDASTNYLDGAAIDSNPMCSAQAAQFPGVTRGDHLQITPDATGVAQLFKVARAAPDGAGSVVLDLQELAP